MTAFSADSIESSTVVGYQTVTIPEGFSLWTPTFVDVNAETFDLANFRLADNAAGDGTDQIQVLDADGLVSQIWIWLNANSDMEPGWYDFDSWDPIEAGIAQGVGYLMNVPADIDLLMKGVVLAGERSTTLTAGFNVCGNNAPVEIALADMKLADNAAGDGTEQIQVLDADGLVSQIWIWLNSNSDMDSGWYDFDSWDPIEAVIAPGQAYLMNVPQDVAVTMPSAL